MPDDEIILDTRPREGDLVYFPLGQRIFEVKRVEHEQPFYQLGTNYVYKLQCELFQYESEDIDTSIDFIDEQIKEQGYITELTLVGTGVTATLRVDSFGRSGIIREIVVNDDGAGYVYPPTVSISTSPALLPNSTAEAVAITTQKGGVYSIDRVLLTNPGFGYTSTNPPTVTFTSIANTAAGGSGVYGTGAAATAVINDLTTGITSIRVTNGGSNYYNEPIIVGLATLPGITSAVLEPQISNGVIQSIYFRNTGVGYTNAPALTLERSSGIGTTEPNELNYQYNEEIVGSSSSVTARVRDWNASTGILKVGINSGTFRVGEIVIGSASTARRKVASYETFDETSPYDQNKEFEDEGLNIIDFTESNPFGDF